MIASRYFLWFLLYSLFGWIFECTYGVIVTKKWENRGFLHGPIVPIYGVGAVVITGFYDILTSKGINLACWQIFLISFLGSMVLEYSTSWILEKRFHAVWWDYSNMPFNLNGRICLPASTAFGLAGLLVIKITAPFLKHATMSIPMIIVEVSSLIIMAILSADMTLTVSALTGFASMVSHVEKDINAYMEGLVEKAVSTGSSLQDKDGLFKERMENILKTADPVKLHAVKRVSKFRFEKTDMSPQKVAYINKAHKMLKKKLTDKKLS